MQAAAVVGRQGPLENVHRGRLRSASTVYPPAPREREAPPVQLQKAASYTYFPHVKDLDEPTALLELKGTITEDELKNGTSTPGGTSEASSGGSSPDSEEAPQGLQMPQLRPANSRRASRFLPFTGRGRDQGDDPKSGQEHKKTRREDASPSSMSPVRSLSRLRRKSWISSGSRASSPTKNKESAAKTEEGRKSFTAEANRRKSLTSALSIPEKVKVARGVTDSATDPKSRLLVKKAKRPLSGIFTSSNSHQATPEASNVPAVPPLPRSFSGVPPVPPLPKSFSTERLPSFSQQTPLSPTHIPPLPRSISSDKLKGTRTEPRKKDELWTVFRTLESDLRKFQSKSSSLKTNVLRTTLLPFLRSYATHPSNHKLRPEDLDRRANILNGWWTGLLELLAGRNNQSISGTDRPAILEGISGIMERSEWRLSPSPFCALADRAERMSTSTTGSAGSHTSSNSDFLAESVYHNVRNVFTQNLLSQFTFVVDKMSLRNAAASLVTFCGKTCAYAFCFCPGVSDVLVRLWNPSLDLMKRVLDESGISRQDRLDEVSDHIVPSFPPMMHTLKFTSLAKMVRLLRQPASLPLGTANLDWYGPWVKRWSGAESDLFYVFVKHYHILIADFLPVEPSVVERICVPGLVMVHAQILANLDATINRHAAPQQPEEPITGAASLTFDEVLQGDTDTSVSLPIPPANATRQMAENRMIMLIRDFLSERNAHLHTPRRLFADGFARLLKAAARKVSIYNNHACYTLCDFLEEAFFLIIRYEQFGPQQHSVLDWTFWISVCRKMTSSHNTATEIKLFAFLYNIWSVVVADETRKASLCLDLLLEPEFFESSFNHWCPMVRSYFMRLLCWRVARFDGEDSEVETSILRTLSDRLRSVWSHYLWLRDEADSRQSLSPSTQACNPAPGRRFLIIRSDNPIVTNSGPFISFDGVVQSPTPRRVSASTPVSEPEVRPQSSASMDSDFGEEDTTKGRWNILRSFIGAPKQTAKLKSAIPARKENTKAASILSNSTTETPTSKPVPTEALPPAPTHRSYSFRFSLEWVDKRFGSFQPMRLSAPRLPVPAQVMLQNKGININAMHSSEPTGFAADSSRYAGRALAEWTFISHECQNFFDRRKNEGVPANRLVETPTLAVEAFRRPS